jgi:uncharacterized protein (DUF305 family)
MKYYIIILLVLINACKNNSNAVLVKDRIDSVLSVNHMADTENMHKLNKENIMLESMMETMKKMNTLKMGNDFDVDFANIMTVHHQAAIDMSMLEIATGKNTEIINMAKNIITTQKEEITNFQKFVMNYKVPYPKTDNSDSQNILEDEMKNMTNTINGMKLLGGIDDNYVMLMIAHHNSAIKMAKDEITFGKQKQIKEMAEKIVATQITEINKLVAWGTH